MLFTLRKLSIKKINESELYRARAIPSQSMVMYGGGLLKLLIVLSNSTPYVKMDYA